jgi:hypothetical protein
VTAGLTAPGVRAAWGSSLADAVGAAVGGCALVVGAGAAVAAVGVGIATEAGGIGVVGAALITGPQAQRPPTIPAATMTAGTMSLFIIPP